MAQSRYTLASRLFALFALAAFLSACTRQVAREPVETRHYQVEWENLEHQTIAANGVLIEAIPLTPSQWPLEGSVKSLFSGDFVGVFDNFDWRFHSSKLEEDVLEDLFDEGYVPVYMRVTNTGDAQRTFVPFQAGLELDGGTSFWPVHPNALPEAFREIDWSETGRAVVVTALVAVLIVLAVAAGRDSGNADFTRGVTRVTGEVVVRSPELVRGGENEAAAARARPDNTGLITVTDLQPGASTEGFLFFQVDQTVLDWTTATLHWNGAR